MERPPDKLMQRFAHGFYYPTPSMLKQEVFAYGINPVTKVVFIYSSQGITLYSAIEESIVKCKSLLEMFKENSQPIIEHIECLVLDDIWIMAKNRKSLLVIDSNLDKYHESTFDQAQISALQLNQKNEEIFTLSKDFKSLKIYYINKPDKKQRKEQKAFNHMPALKKTIYFNYPVSSIQIACELGLFTLNCNYTKEISVWGYNNQLYLYVIKTETAKKSSTGLLEGSFDPKKMSQNEGQPKITEQGNDIITSINQELLFVYTNFNKKLFIWNLSTQTPMHCCSLGIDNVQVIKSQLSDMTSGTIIMDSDLTLYDCNVLTGSIVGRMKITPPNVVESHNLFESAVPAASVIQDKSINKIEVYIKKDGTEGIIANHNKVVQFVDFLTKCHLFAHFGKPITSISFKPFMKEKGDIKNYIEIIDDDKKLLMINPDTKKIQYSINPTELPFIKETKKAIDISYIAYDLSYLVIIGLTEQGWMFIWNGITHKVCWFEFGRYKILNMKFKADTFCSDKITEWHIEQIIGTSEQVNKLPLKFSNAAILIVSASGVIFHLDYNPLENTLALVKKITASLAITYCQFVEDEDATRIIVSIKDRVIEIFKYNKQISFFKQIFTMKAGITAFSLTKEGINVVGYDNGSIHSHPLENINIQHHFKVHEYHEASISIIYTLQKDKFISACQKMKIAYWSIMESAPLKVCQFADPVRSILCSDSNYYVALNDCIASVHSHSISDAVSIDIAQWERLVKERNKVNANFKKSKSINTNSLFLLTQNAIENTKKMWDDGNTDSLMPKLYKSILGIDKSFFMTLIEMEYLIYQKNIANSQLYYLADLLNAQKKPPTAKEKKKKVTKLVVNFEESESNIDIKKL